MTPSSPRLSKTKGGVVPTSLRIDISHLAGTATSYVYSLFLFYLLIKLGSELAEMDLEVFGGLSDPFIIITADPPQIIPKDKHGDREIKSSTIYRSINPVW